MLCAIADDLKWSLAQSQHLKTRQPSLSPSACLQLVNTNFQNHFRNFRCRVQNKSSQFANCDLFLENCEWNFAKKFQTLFLMIKLFFPSNCFNCLARTFHTHPHPQLALVNASVTIGKPFTQRHYLSIWGLILCLLCLSIT